MKLVPRTREEVCVEIDAMSPEIRAQVSADWLALLGESSSQDAWVHGFHVLDADGQVVGLGSFKGPPFEGVVEIAYAIVPEHQRKGHATATARELVVYAFASGEVHTVRAHTLPDGSASQRVLEKSGFSKVAEVIDPEDGLVWRFEVFSHSRAANNAAP
jgi:RimJ/RimL family protein N-acetyltransferase